MTPASGEMHPTTSTAKSAYLVKRQQDGHSKISPETRNAGHLLTSGVGFVLLTPIPTSDFYSIAFFFPPCCLFYQEAAESQRSAQRRRFPLLSRYLNRGGFKNCFPRKSRHSHLTAAGLKYALQGEKKSSKRFLGQNKYFFHQVLKALFCRNSSR